MTKILHISEAASLALHSMMIIARSTTQINANEIAEATGASRNHLAKVLQRLVKQNLLKSNRGPHGGFLLKKKPEQISLLEIYEIFEGQYDTSGCPLECNKCPFNGCMIDDISSRISNDFFNFFKEKTLKDYL